MDKPDEPITPDEIARTLGRVLEFRSKPRAAATPNAPEAADVRIPAKLLEHTLDHLDLALNGLRGYSDIIRGLGSSVRSTIVINGLPFDEFDRNLRDDAVPTTAAFGALLRQTLHVLRSDLSYEQAMAELERLQRQFLERPRP
jgi:hypothetical protein